MAYGRPSLDRSVSVDLFGALMMNFFKHTINRVWAILIVLTMGTWLLGESYGVEGPAAAKYLTVAILCLAFLKIRLVIRNFMEVKKAVLPLRIILDVWVFGVLSAVLFFYLNPRLF